MRLNHDTYFMVMAKVASLRSVCRSRQVGAILVDINNYLLASGYNGPPKGIPECDPCKRVDIESGTGLDRCIATHSEANALLQCPDIQRIHSLYVTISPCFGCIKLLLNTPCQRIVFVNSYPNPESEIIWKDAGREWIQLRFPTKARSILENLTKLADYMHVSS